jgi:hypothetical protein
MTTDTGAVRGTVVVFPMVFGEFPVNAADASPTRLPCIVRGAETPVTGVPVGSPTVGGANGSPGLVGLDGFVGFVGVVGVPEEISGVGMASPLLFWHPVSASAKTARNTAVSHHGFMTRKLFINIILSSISFIFLLPLTSNF